VALSSNHKNKAIIEPTATDTRKHIKKPPDHIFQNTKLIKIRKVAFIHHNSAFIFNNSGKLTIKQVQYLMIIFQHNRTHRNYLRKILVHIVKVSEDTFASLKLSRFSG
jgi:hypothetical protein